MPHRIPFKEGAYVIDHAYLVTPLNRSVLLTEGVLEVYKDPAGEKHLRGRAFVNNALMVALLEDEESLHLLMDLGPGFRYQIPHPILQAGKVFEPLTRSIVHFAPSQDLVPLTDPDYEKITAGLAVLRPGDGHGGDSRGG